jgi:hypothetical protein
MFAFSHKVVNEADRIFINDKLMGFEIIGYLPYSENFRQSDREGVSALDCAGPEAIMEFDAILKKLTC